MDILEWLSMTPVATSLKRSATLYLLVNAAHILSIGLLVGAIVPLDLRIIGLFRSVPLEIIGPFLSRSAAIGICAAIATGLCLFSVRPLEYAANPAFLAKIGLLGLGVANAAILHAGRGWKRTLTAGVAPPGVRLSAALSLVAWTSAVIAGRWIGFL